MLKVEEALDIIRNNKRVGIVGLSPRTDRPSHKVGNFLQEKGFEITPINPGYSEILGRAGVSGLDALEPGDVDWLDLFVSPARLMSLADDIVRLSPKLVWCQIGVVNREFNQKLEDFRIPFIADVCPKIELAK